MLDRPRYDVLHGGEPETQDVVALAARCLDLGAKIVVVKCGARGLYVRTAGMARLAEMGRAAPAHLVNWARCKVWSPCFTPEPLVGTTGAGDATIAGFLAALLRGESLAQARIFVDLERRIDCGVDEPQDARVGECDTRHDDGHGHADVHARASK